VVSEVVYLTILHQLQGVWDRVIGIANRYGLEGSGYEHRWEQEIFSSPYTRPDRPLDLISLQYDRYRGSFPAEKRSARGVRPPIPSGAEVKNEQSDTSTLPLCETSTCTIFPEQSWNVKRFRQLIKNNIRGGRRIVVQFLSRGKKCDPLKLV
jgi:hypothetical protein